jgi:hypothetical protein
MLIKDVAPPSGKTTSGTAKPSFLTKVKTILAYPASAISAPPFKCKLTEQAARENLSILAKHNYNTGEVIENSRFSPMSIGSEFKPAEVLEPLLGNLKSWPLLKKSLIFGASVLKLPLSPTSCKKKNIAVRKGNTRSAVEEIPDLATEQIDLMRHNSPDYLLFGAETARDARLREEPRATCL